VYTWCPEKSTPFTWIFSVIPTKNSIKEYFFTDALYTENIILLFPHGRAINEISGHSILINPLHVYHTMR